MAEITVLDSGVRLVTEKMDSVRSVSVGIWCDTGSVYEKPEEFGMSHYIEHMLFKGTETRSAFQIADEIDRIGGQMNAFTGKEYTCFYVKSLDHHFRKTAEVLTDMIEHPSFDSEEMEREKKVVIEEINMNADDPDDVALDKLEAIVNEGSGMAHPVLGYKNTVSSFTRDMVEEYYYSHYTRDAIVVSVAGSFDYDEVKEYFSGKFMGLRASRNSFSDPHVENPGQKVDVVKDIDQAHLALGVSLIPAGDSRKYPVSVLSSIMGGGMSSRLFQTVREQKGLAYSVYTMTGYYRSSGMFVICAGVGKDRVKEAIDAIFMELHNLKNGEISQEELDSSREQLKSVYIFGEESVQTRMIANGKDLLAYGRCRDQEEILSGFDKVTLDDLYNVRELICYPDKYTIVNVTGKEN